MSDLTAGVNPRGRFWLAIAAVGLAAIAPFLYVGGNRARHSRDVTREVHQSSLAELANARLEVSATNDSLVEAVSAPVDSVGTRPFIVVSITDHRLWLRHRDDVLFTTRVATGSGKLLAKPGGKLWKFETPRGRLVVLSKESDPVWAPPDWHYVEMAHKKKLRTRTLGRSDSLVTSDGSVVAVAGKEVVRRWPDGRQEFLEASEGRELVVDGRILIPPFGTNQRKYAGVVGTNRLNLGDGYALHGTDVPSSIGTSVSHGCVRMRNEDAETLFRMVAVGTPVYIY